MGFFNELGEAFQVESWRLNHVPMVGGIPHEARKAVLQKIQIPCGPLDVGERSWIGRLQKIEPVSAHDDEAEVPDKLLVVLLADAVKIHDLAVEVVQHLNLRRLLVEKHLCATCECFHIGRVLRKYFN